jgi:uncharacterized protein YyaL (SSP411 family)
MHDNDQPQGASAKRLEGALSPYLQHHAHNPVDWWPFSNEALLEARTKDLPLFISIGYSSCHWCHVMENECFEDIEVAALINSTTIPIKVDREERPDIDAIYMEALQAMSGSGGWPMTIFATPDGRPFFAATYLPKHPRGSMPGLMQILEAVSKAWNGRRSELIDEAERITKAIRARSTYAGASIKVDEYNDPYEAVQRSVSEFLSVYDKEWGGFGRAPKFPQPAVVELLLNHFRVTKDHTALDAATHTLDKIYRGGVFDHIGGGLFRYSTDRFWIVPHFEKMLYDQAGLLRAATSHYLLTKDLADLYVINRIHHYVSQTLYRGDGAVYSSQDADSEGEEGAYYLFREAEIEEVLGEDAASFIGDFGVTKAGNFEGSNILHRGPDGPMVPSEATARSIARLEQYRRLRVPPEIDKKVLTEWNAMWAGALFYAGRALGRPDFIKEATEVLHFLLENHCNESFSLIHSSYEGSSSPGGYLSDYAHISSALLEAFFATAEHRYVDLASSFVRFAIDHYYDTDEGGFYLADKETTLIANPKEILDGATPSSNSVLLRSIVRIARVTDDPTLNSVLQSCISWGKKVAQHSASGTATFALAAYEAEGGLNELVIGDQAPNDLIESVKKMYLPNTLLCIGSFGEGPLYEGRDERYAYLCEGYSCKQPTQDLDELEGMLG